MKTALSVAKAHCEFCVEFSSPERARFFRQYTIQSRIIHREDGIVVIPTLGQLFSGSVLILPVEHRETFSQLEPMQIATALGLVQQLLPRLKKLGCPVLFEHGAQSCTGGGCGIYHAHLHLVPLPTDMSIHDAFPSEVNVERAESLLVALGKLRGTREYLVYSTAAGETGYVDTSNSSFRFSSQYFRKRIRDHFSLDVDWDWHSYDTPEESVLETLRSLGGEHVFGC